MHVRHRVKKGYTFEGELLLLDEDADWITHEARCHLKYI